MHVEGLKFNAPLSFERACGLLDRLELGASSRVLDVGCGRGELLSLLAERSGCAGVGVDPKAREIALARQRSEATRARLAWHEARIQDVTLDAAFDAAICIGATHAFGPPGAGLKQTLAALSERVRAGGRLLIGEGYWRQEPPPEYLRATGFERHHLLDHDANVELSEALGLRLAHAETSSVEEWEAFEGAFRDAAETALRAAPSDPMAQKDAAHWRRWFAAFERWGRATLGFGYYLFTKP